MYIYRIYSLLDSPSFLQDPLDQNQKLKSTISLSCSYKNFTGVTFQWLKDGKVFVPPIQPAPRRSTDVESSTALKTAQSETYQSVILSPVTPVRSRIESLRLYGTDPEIQGYYSCYVKDALDHVAISKSSLVRFSGKFRIGNSLLLTNEYILHMHRERDIEGDKDRERDR